MQQIKHVLAQGPANFILFCIFSLDFAAFHATPLYFIPTRCF